MSDYKKYRGKCKEMSEELVASDPSLRLVRGFYFCPIWGKQGHWWCVKNDGTIVDPTARQFPSKGFGKYEEFNGIGYCAECQKEISEDEALNRAGNDLLCSTKCYCRYVGVEI